MKFFISIAVLLASFTVYASSSSCKEQLQAEKKRNRSYFLTFTKYQISTSKNLLAQKKDNLTRSYLKGASDIVGKITEVSGERFQKKRAERGLLKKISIGCRAQLQEEKDFTTAYAVTLLAYKKITVDRASNRFNDAKTSYYYDGAKDTISAMFSEIVTAN